MIPQSPPDHHAALVARLVAAKERRMLDLLDVRFTVDGPATPDAAAVADQLRAMIATIEPAPVPVLMPGRNRRQRRAAAARARGRA